MSTMIALRTNKTKDASAFVLKIIECGMVTQHSLGSITHKIMERWCRSHGALKYRGSLARMCFVSIDTEYSTDLHLMLALKNTDDTKVLCVVDDTIVKQTINDAHRKYNAELKDAYEKNKWSGTWYGNAAGKALDSVMDMITNYAVDELVTRLSYPKLSIYEVKKNRR